MERDDTIAALATPPGRGALALIRISGPDTLFIVERLVVEKEKFRRAKSAMVRRYSFSEGKNESEVIDTCTIVKYQAPRSFTGENMAEIICHGGTLVVRSILEALTGEGVRPAQPGEFTRRAFYNGKTSLDQAEAIHQIVTSESLQRRREALRSYMGGYLPVLMQWKEEVEELCVELESAIEFGEEDDVIEKKVGEDIPHRIRGLRENIEHELNRRRSVRQGRRGLEVAIVGPPNAGKSSLLNTILGYERALTHEEGGTTRDTISEEAILEGIEVRFVDTAGVRRPQSGVEKKGIERTWQYITASDIVILVTAADEHIYQEEIKILERGGEKERLITVINKIDLGNGREKERFIQDRGIAHIKTSVIMEENRETILSFIREKIVKIACNSNSGSIIITERQEKIIEEVVQKLKEAEGYGGGEEEITAHCCKAVIDLFDEYTGKRSCEEMLDLIFSEFCIGK